MTDSGFRKRAASDLTLLAALVLAAAAATVSLVLRSLIPVQVYRADFDNSLYVRLATELSRGQWLGSYNNLTLARVPAYPMFVAWMRFLGLPLKLGEQFTAVLAALALGWCIWLAVRRPLLAAGAAAVLVLDAGQFTGIAAQVRRDGWYASLTVLLVCLAWLVLRAVPGRARPRWLVLGGVALGLVLVTFWLCREEGVWILPTLVIMPAAALAGALWRGWRSGRAPGSGQAGLPAGLRAGLWVRLRVRLRAGLGVGWRPGLRLGLALICAATAVLVPIQLIKNENQSRYGVAVVTDAGQFNQMYAPWAGVQAGPAERYVAITAAQRAAVYAVSPTAALLQPQLESPRNVWLHRGANTCPQYHPCDEFAAALEAFAFRDAMTHAGYYDDALDAQLFTNQVSSQIGQACRSHLLQCRSGISALPGVRSLYPGDSFRGTWNGLVFAAGSRSLVQPEGTVLRLHGWSLQTQTDTAAVVIWVPATAAGVDALQQAYQGRYGFFQFWAGLYHLLLPVLLVLGLIGALGALLLVRRGAGPLGVLALGLATAAVSRAALLGVFSATTLPGSDTAPTYQAVTRELLLAFGLVGTVQLVQLLPRRGWRWRLWPASRGQGPSRTGTDRELSTSPSR